MTAPMGPDTNALIRQFIAEGLSHREAYRKAIAISAEWAYENGYAVKAPGRKVK